MARDGGRGDLDDVDRGIVALLQRNGRMPNLEIARQLGVAEATVRKRMERLVDDGLVRVRAVVNPSTMGYPVRTLIGIRVELSRVQGVARQLAGMPSVRSISLTAGSYDLVIEAAFASNESLEGFLMGRLAPIPGVIHTDTFHVLRTIKEAADWLLPEGEEMRSTTAKKVLVVDDDPSFRTICRAILSKSGYTVVTAVDGADGLAKAREERPDVVLLDFMMATPMEGQEAIWNIREDPDLQGLPVLMISSVGSRHPLWKVQPSAEELPVDGWLDKPVAPERLLSEVARVLEKQSQAGSAG